MPAVIVLAYLSLLMLGLLDNIRGPFFFEILEDLKLGGTAGSAFFAVTSFMAFFGSWFSHRLLRGRDPLAVLAGTSIVFSIGFAGVSRSPGFGWLLVFSGVFGLAYGTLNVLQNILVCEAAPPESRRRYLNGLQAMYGLAALLAPLTATSFRLAGWDWRTVFIALAALPILLAAPAWYFRGQVQVHEEAPKPWGPRDRKLCLGFMILLAIYLWGELSISTRLVLWLRTQHGFTPAAAESQLAIFFVLLLAGRLALAYFPLKSVSNWTILMISAFLSCALYLLGLLFSPYFMAFSGLTLAPFFPVTMDQVAISFGDKAPRAVGAIIGIANLSVVAMHFSIGALTDLSDLTSALLVGPLALFIAGLGLLGLRLKQGRP